MNLYGALCPKKCINQLILSGRIPTKIAFLLILIFFTKLPLINSIEIYRDSSVVLNEKNEVTFHGHDYVQITFPEEIGTEAEEISFWFQTNNTLDKDGTLLTALNLRSERISLQLALMDSTLKIYLNFGPGAIVFRQGSNLTDGEWHRVYYKRFGEELHLQIDDGGRESYTIPGLGNRFRDSIYGEDDNIQGFQTNSPPTLFGTTTAANYFQSNFSDTDHLKNTKTVRHSRVKQQHRTLANMYRTPTLYFRSIDIGYVTPPSLSGDLLLVDKNVHRYKNNFSTYTHDGFKGRMRGLVFNHLHIFETLADGIVVSKTTSQQDLTRSSPHPQNRFMTLQTEIRKEANGINGMTIEQGTRSLVLNAETNSQFEMGKNEIESLAHLATVSSSAYYNGYSGSLKNGKSLTTTNHDGTTKIRKNDLLISSQNNINNNNQNNFLLILQPVTFNTPDAFLTLTKPLTDTKMNIYLRFRTITPYGIILYYEGIDMEFMCLELVDGLVNYIFNFGSGPQYIRSDPSNRLDNNEWHEVTISKTNLDDHVLIVDFEVYKTLSRDTKFKFFESNGGTLYVGGVPEQILNFPPGLIQSTQGYQGCLASLNINGWEPDLMVEALYKFQPPALETGCTGPKEQCIRGSQSNSQHPLCKNNGKCVQHWNDWTCDCRLSGYVSIDCSDYSEASYKFGMNNDPYDGQNNQPHENAIFNTYNRPNNNLEIVESPTVNSNEHRETELHPSGGGIATYYYPTYDQSDSKYESLAIGFATAHPYGELVSIRSSQSHDYLIVSLVNGQISVKVDLGIGEMTLKTRVRSNTAKAAMVKIYDPKTNHTKVLFSHERRRIDNNTTTFNRIKRNDMANNQTMADEDSDDDLTVSNNNSNERDKRENRKSSGGYQFSNTFANGKYHVINYFRIGLNLMLMVNGKLVQRKTFRYKSEEPLENPLLFNSVAEIYLGGNSFDYFSSTTSSSRIKRKQGIRQTLSTSNAKDLDQTIPNTHFQGILSGVSFNGLMILEEMLAGSSNTFIEGDVTKVVNMTEELKKLSRLARRKNRNKTNTKSTSLLNPNMDYMGTETTSDITSSTLIKAIVTCSPNDVSDCSNSQAIKNVIDDRLVTPILITVATQRTEQNTTDDEDYAYGYTNFDNFSQYDNDLNGVTQAAAPTFLLTSKVHKKGSSSDKTRRKLTSGPYWNDSKVIANNDDPVDFTTRQIIMLLSKQKEVYDNTNVNYSTWLKSNEGSKDVKGQKIPSSSSKNRKGRTGLLMFDKRKARIFIITCSVIAAILIVLCCIALCCCTIALLRKKRKKSANNYLQQKQQEDDSNLVDVSKKAAYGKKGRDRNANTNNTNHQGNNRKLLNNDQLTTPLMSTINKTANNGGTYESESNSSPNTVVVLANKGAINRTDTPNKRRSLKTIHPSANSNNHNNNDQQQHPDAKHFSYPNIKPPNVLEQQQQKSRGIATNSNTTTLTKGYYLKKAGLTPSDKKDYADHRSNITAATTNLGNDRQLIRNGYEIQEPTFLLENISGGTVEGGGDTDSCYNTLSRTTEPIADEFPINNNINNNNYGSSNIIIHPSNHNYTNTDSIYPTMLHDASYNNNGTPALNGIGIYKMKTMRSNNENHGGLVNIVGNNTYGDYFGNSHQHTNGSTYSTLRKSQKQQNCLNGTTTTVIPPNLPQRNSKTSLHHRYENRGQTQEGGSLEASWEQQAKESYQTLPTHFNTKASNNSNKLLHHSQTQNIYKERNETNNVLGQPGDNALSRTTMGGGIKYDYSMDDIIAYGYHQSLLNEREKQRSSTTAKKRVNPTSNKAKPLKPYPNIMENKETTSGLPGTKEWYV